MTTLYLVLAALLWAGLPVSVARTPSASIVLCLCWPLVVLMYCIRDGARSTPEFRPSLLQAAWIVAIGVAPIAMRLIRS